MGAHSDRPSWVFSCAPGSGGRPGSEVWRVVGAPWRKSSWECRGSGGGDGALVRCPAVVVVSLEASAGISHAQGRSESRTALPVPPLSVTVDHAV